MLIDDDEDTVTTFKTGLEENGFSVDGFVNPFEALARFKESNEKTYHLLLIDLKYNKENYGINGFQLYEQMRDSGKKLPHTCFTTAFPDYYYQLKPLYPKINVQCFVRKPIYIVDLVAQLKQELQAPL